MNKVITYIELTFFFSTPIRLPTAIVISCYIHNAISSTEFESIVIINRYACSVSFKVQ